MSNNFKLRFFSTLFMTPMVFFIVLTGSFFFIIFIFFCFILTAYEWFFLCKNNKYFIFGLIFISLSYLTVYDLRFNSSYHDNLFNFLLILIICISTDIGGYIFGKIFKGPKLTKISPNKTLAGSFGGYFCSVGNVLFFYYFYFLNFHNLNLDSSLILFTIIISTISQIGDIIISYFIRQSNIKNTGNIIPGHGGILDRIDGMIFAFPACYLLFQTGQFNFI